MNAKANRVSETKDDAKALNHYLDILRAQAYEARKSLIDAARVVTASAIVNIMNGAEQRDRKVLVLFKKHNDEIGAIDW
jgi:hypothetical protein